MKGKNIVTSITNISDINKSSLNFKAQTSNANNQQNYKYQTNNIEQDRFESLQKKQKKKNNKWIALGVIGTPIVLCALDMVLMKGRISKSILNRHWLTNEEAKLLEEARTKIKDVNSKIKTADTEIKSSIDTIKGYGEKAKEITKDKNNPVADGNREYFSRLGEFGFVGKDNGQKNEEFLYRWMNPTIGGKYGYKKYGANGKEKEFIKLEQDYDILKGEMYQRHLYDETGKKIKEECSAAGGIVIQEFENGQPVRKLERTKTALLGDYTTRYIELDTNGNPIKTVEACNDVYNLNGVKFNDKNPLYRILEFMSDIGL